MHETLNDFNRLVSGTLVYAEKSLPQTLPMARDHPALFHQSNWRVKAGYSNVSETKYKPDFIENISEHGKEMAYSPVGKNYEVPEKNMFEMTDDFITRASQLILALSVSSVALVAEFEGWFLFNDTDFMLSSHE